MPVYVCRVSDTKGKIEEFLREAASEEPLLRELSSASRFVLSLKELAVGEAAPKAGKRFSRRDVGELTDLLTLTLGSGLSLKDSLEVAQTVSTHGSGSDLVTLLLDRIRKGSTFAAALEGTGNSFPPVYRGIVRIGERIGSLERVFGRLSQYLGDQKRLRERFGAALLYPAIVMGAVLATAVLIVVVLLPRLREIFNQIGPGIAGKVETMMQSLTAAFVVLGAMLIVGAALLIGVQRARHRGGRLAVRIDTLLLRAPVLATFLVQRELLNFAFAMETLTASGVSVEEALAEGAGAVENRALRKEIFEIRERVLKGEHLSAAFAGCVLFPARVSRWVGIGERVGHVEKVFGQLRAYYHQEVEKWLGRLMVLLEPALIVALGIMIILFVVLFIVPIFSLYGTML